MPTLRCCCFFITASSLGNSFFLAFPLTPEQQISSFELIITTPSDEAHYSVWNASGKITNGTTTHLSPASVFFSNSFDVLTSGFADRLKGIQVRATGESLISVLVITRSHIFSSLINTAASYLVHYNSEIANNYTYVYFALSTDYAGVQNIVNRKSNILLVANSHNTMVNITPTQTVVLPENSQVNSSMISVEMGSSYQTTLHQFQTFLISSLSDLTGTRIVSNRPLTVISGHQCAQIPTIEPFCEPLYIHVPPTASWGQAFLLAPFAGRTSSVNFKLVTSQNNTAIAYRCGTEQSQGITLSLAGDSSILAFLGTPFCYLTATSPILVAQVGSGYNTDERGDPAVALVSPITGHVSRTQFFTPSDNFPQNFISVTVQAQFFNVSHILLDGNRLVCMGSWSAIQDITSDVAVGYGCTANVTSGSHNVTHEIEGGVLSVAAYGWNSNPQLGYAYLTGINLGLTTT